MKKILSILLCLAATALGGVVVTPGSGWPISQSSISSEGAPAEPVNLVQNGRFIGSESPWTMVPADQSEPPVSHLSITTNASGGYATHAETDEGLTAGGLIWQSINVTNGWTYQVVLTIFNASQENFLEVHIGSGHGLHFPENSLVGTTDGTYTQLVVCGSADTSFAVNFASSGNIYGCSVSNIQCYAYSAP